MSSVEIHAHGMPRERDGQIIQVPVVDVNIIMNIPCVSAETTGGEPSASSGCEREICFHGQGRTTIICRAFNTDGESCHPSLWKYLDTMVL